MLDASAGSVVLSIQIVVPANAAASVPIASIASSVASANASALASTLGANVTQVAGPVVRNRTYTVSSVSTRIVEISCYPGHWCTGSQGAIRWRQHAAAHGVLSRWASRHSACRGEMGTRSALARSQRSRAR